MITERDYVIAIWRLKKHRVPDRMDWLHDAVVEYYEKSPSLEEGRIGNWLGLVAWRKWQDFTKKLSTRKTFSSENMDCFEAEEEGGGGFDWSPVVSGMSQKQRDTLALWKMGLNQPQSARAVGICTQAMSQRRHALLKYLRKRLTNHG